MIDYFALALCHALLLIALLRLLRRDDVDSDAALAQEQEHIAEPELSRRERRARRRLGNDRAGGRTGGHTNDLGDHRNGNRSDA